MAEGKIKRLTDVTTLAEWDVVEFDFINRSISGRFYCLGRDYNFLSGHKKLWCDGKGFDEKEIKEIHGDNRMDIGFFCLESGKPVVYYIYSGALDARDGKLVQRRPFGFFDISIVTVHLDKKGTHIYKNAEEELFKLEGK